MKEGTFYKEIGGFFEFWVGNLMIFSRPREDENDPKIFFMVPTQTTGSGVIVI